MKKKNLKKKISELQKIIENKDKTISNLIKAFMWTKRIKFK